MYAGFSPTGGRYRVEYEDGQRSYRTTLGNAENYAAIFGGKVICVNPKWLDRIRAWRGRLEIDDEAIDAQEAE